MPTFVKWRSCCCCCCCCVIISMKKVISDMSYRGQDFCSIDRVLVTEWRSGSEEIWMGMNSEKRWMSKTISLFCYCSLHCRCIRRCSDTLKIISSIRCAHICTHFPSYLSSSFLFISFFLFFLPACLHASFPSVRPSFLPFHSASRPISFSSLLPPFPLAVPVPLYRLLPVPP